MKKRSESRTHLLVLVGAPLLVHGLATLFFGFEAEGSSLMLCAAMLASGACGALIGMLRYGLPVAILAAGWPSVIAGTWRWHWSIGMPSPAGAAQELARWAVWSEASAAQSLILVLGSSGAAGWTLMRFDRWYEKKTGRSLFEER